MITNNLMLKLKERTNENIEKAKAVLMNMEGKIQPLVSVKVETDIRKGGSSYDLLLVTTFHSMEDFDAYIVDPVHVEVSKYILNVIETAASVCHES